jgi:glucokinase
MERTECVISLDIGGTGIKNAVVTDRADILFLKQQETRPKRNAEEIINDINSLIEDSIKDALNGGFTIRGVGIVTPGYPDKDGYITFIPSIPALTHYPIKEHLIITGRFPIRFENDGNAGAYGEYIFGQKKQSRNIIVLTIGTGMGSGAVVDGHIFRGKDNISGELGHITLNPDGPLCLCGKHGCLESYFSAFALVQAVKETLSNGGKSSLDKYPIDKMTPEIIATEAMRGDRTALSIFKSAAKWFGVGIAVLINVFNPDKVILAGGLLKASELFFPTVLDEVSKHLHPQYQDEVLIELSQFRQNLGIIGAASLFYQ